MGAINGEVNWGQVMLWYNGSGYMMQDQQYPFSGGYVVSANSPIFFQIVWTDVSGDVPDGLNEQYIPQNEGDIVNIIFHVLGTTEYPLPGFSEWDTLATIR